MNLHKQREIMQVTIYHNPRCSKSRQALALLQENNIDPNIVLYLDTPPKPTEIKSLLSLLGMSAQEIIRKKEKEYSELELNKENLSENELIETLSKHPKLIERPILVVNNKAIIARPPEKLLEVIK